MGLVLYWPHSKVSRCRLSDLRKGSAATCFLAYACETNGIQGYGPSLFRIISNSCMIYLNIFIT